MLNSVKISNIALIEDVEIKFNSGLNIMSGETGAGKSIILNSLNLILGEQAKMDLIRSGEQGARIQAIFNISGYEELKKFLQENLGISTEENLLILDREIDVNRGSTAYVNHNRVLIQSLKQIGTFLIDIHGQHQNQSLFDRKNHLKLLDNYSGLSEKVEVYRREFQQAIQLNKELKEKLKLEEEKEKFFQFGSYALEEIQKADLKPGEEVELDEELKRLSNVQEIKQSLEDAFYISYKSEDSAYTQLQKAQSILEKTKEKDREVKRILPFLEDALIKMEPVIDFLKSYKDEIESSEERMEEVSRRLKVIRELKGKYGNTIEEIIAYGEKLLLEMEAIEQNQEEMEKLEKEIDILRTKLGETALEISARRREGAKLLERAIEEELAFLGMDKARFQVNFQYLEDPDGKIVTPEGSRVKLSRDGIEKIEFLISTNLGENFRPLVKVASGGEISRIMLSIKNILRRLDPIETLIFDEIDAGIGGETAFAVGKKLKEISTDKQVLCITHLAQIASMGEHHYKVVKTEEANRTKTQIFALNEEERIREISRMLSGDQITDITIEHAKQFLESNLG